MKTINELYEEIKKEKEELIDKLNDHYSLFQVPEEYRTGVVNRLGERIRTLDDILKKIIDSNLLDKENAIQKYIDSKKITTNLFTIYSDDVEIIFKKDKVVSISNTRTEGHNIYNVYFSNGKTMSISKEDYYRLKEEL